MRCPICGSKMIYPATEHKNFSGGKAVAGMIAFGVIGGAAGFIGKDTKGYRCSACGAFCQETMAYSTETAINSAVNAAKHNNDFSQYNIFRETYQNLEQIIPSVENIPIKNNSKILQSDSLEEASTLIKRTYKPNLYVCDCPIFVEAIILKTRNNKDFLSFVARNKASNTIRSAYFDVKVLDDADDLILETSCVFQGLSVSSGEYLPADKEFPLNTDLAFKVDFKCVKATFVDDTVWRDEGEPVYTLSGQDVILEENFSKYRALKTKFTENKTSDDVVIYQPIVNENYVQCVCGYPFNPEEHCFNCGRNVEAIGELISFDMLDEYEKDIIKQRAETRYLECKKFRDDALERNYSYSLSLMKKQSVSSLDEAISILSKIEDYKDSKEQIKSCYEQEAQIVEKQAKEEAARLEAERIAEEELIAEEKAKKKKRKKIVAILTSVTCVIMAFVIIFITVIIPNGKYTNAIALMDEGKYTDAIAIFEEIDWYKDSSIKIEESKTAILNEKYNSAVSLMNDGKLDDAYNIFIGLNDYKDSNKMVSKVRLLKSKESLKNIKVGSHIKFGMYEQDNNKSNGKEYIDWLVLEVKDGKAFVISKYLLDEQVYHTECEPVTWETCSLRKWLNNDFINAAFTTEEKEIIPTITVSTEKNPEYNTKPGKATTDKVFLLSFAENVKYIPIIKKAGDTSATQYTISKADYIDNKNPKYWLRTPGETQQSAMYMYNNNYIHYDAYISGEFDHIGNVSLYDVIGEDSVVINDLPVRPAMWIDLSKIK